MPEIATQTEPQDFNVCDRNSNATFMRLFYQGPTYPIYCCSTCNFRNEKAMNLISHIKENPHHQVDGIPQGLLSTCPQMTDVKIPAPPEKELTEAQKKIRSLMKK